MVLSILLKVQVYLVSLHLPDTVLFMNGRFVATLCQADLLVLFSDNHVPQFDFPPARPRVSERADL